jgi:tRNA A-37 threonylcarbamoyl transferase component Bud32
MDTIRICNQCGKPLPQNAPEGLCPECLARVALGSEPAAPGTRVPPDPVDLAAQFPQLEIIQLLGVGGMGMVYKARQPRLDRLVALKILPMDSTPHAAFAERFEREAKALAKLNHPGIVTLYDFGQTRDYYYFMMEYVDGMNLRQLIQARTMEPRQALELVTQICTALQFAHDENIVHRDIKPENILLTRKGQVKIADFGLAKLLGGQPDTALTASMMVMGTLNYMAPEQRQNTKDVDHRADIYSLGVVFYEMLTGEVPMGRFEPPSKRVQVDVRLDEVVLHALEREPARRYQHVSEVKSNVETISSTMPAATPVSSAASDTQKATTEQLPTGIKAVAALLVFSILPVAVALMAGARGNTSEMLLIMAGWGVIVICAIQLLSRQKIQVARERGLWPQLGELPTLDYVKRLAQAGETILAIKLYRELHPASLADARAAVAKLVGPIPRAAEGSEDASKEPNLRLVWMRNFALFCAGWMVTKMLWNFRNPGCWLACFGMASLLMWISLNRMQFFPVQRANWRKFPLSWRILAYFQSIVIWGLLCFTFLIGGIFNYWDGSRLHGSYILRSVEDFEAQYKGKEYHLLQGVPAFSKEIPTVEMLGGYNGFQGGWLFGWGGEHGPGHHYNNTGPNLLVGCLSLFVFTYLAVGSCQFPPKTRKWPILWVHIRASLGICAAALLSLFTLAMFTEPAYLGTRKAGSIARGYHCKADIETVTKAIQTWAERNGYAMGDVMNWNLNTVPKGERVAQARLREVWKPSPFDRWHSTLTSFRRVSPLLNFELVGSEKPAETRVYVTGFMDCSPEEVANGTGQQIPQNLLSLLEKLQSSQAETTSGKDTNERD